MKDMNPHPLSPEEWRQIIAVPAVREAWGLEDAILQRKCTLPSLILARALLDTLETSIFCKAMHSPTIRRSFCGGAMMVLCWYRDEENNASL